MILNFRTVSIVAIAVAFILIFGNAHASETGEELEQVSDFVSGCANKVSLHLVHDVGMRGGFLNRPDESISYGIPLYKIKDRVNVPDVQKIEEELADGFNKRLSDCVGVFSKFPDLKIVAQQPNGLVSVNDEEIIFAFSIPITVVKENQIYSLDNIEDIHVPSKMKLMHEVASTIAKNETLIEICLSCLAELADENNFQIDIVDYDKEASFFIIRHKETGGAVSEFTFAMKK